MITEKDFIQSLGQVIKKKDKVVVIYSGFSNFLNKFDFKNNLIPKILNTIEKFITKERILLLPSFSSNAFIKTKKIDLKTTIDNIGVLPKEALKRNYYRTPQPLHSYLVFGKSLKAIKNLSHSTSWGKGSILDFMSKNDARICTIGLPWNKGCAYLHKFEEDFQVPWRYYKTYEGKMYKNKKFVSNCKENKFSLARVDGPLYNYKPFIKHIKNAKSFCTNNHNDFRIESIKTSCLDKIGKDLFLKDPWCIIKKKKELLNWIKNQKSKDVILNK